MKAIPTKYKGISFRSRLEARWAVFMDEMNIKWVYEPEAYELDGLYYLPDFWLPEMDFFYEIKPEKLNHTESLKAMRLSEHTRKPVYIEFNYLAPFKRNGQPVFSAYKYTPYGDEDDGYWWVECPDCHDIGKAWAGWNRDLYCGCNVPEKHQSHDSPRLIRAYEIAQSKQFWTPQEAL